MVLSNTKKTMIIDGLLFLVILLLFFTDWIQFPFKLPVCALLIMAIAFFKSRHLHEIGFLSKGSLWKTIAWALLIIFIATISIVWTPFLESLFGKPDFSMYGALKGNKDAVIQLWMYAMISAAFAEEVIFRGYFFYLFGTYVGTSKLANAISVVVGALLFTVGHYSQGWSELINIFIVSLIFCAVFIGSGKNIYATILAHAVIDSVSLYQIYTGNI